MATKSFSEALEIRDERAAKALIAAMKPTVKRKRIARTDLSKERERGLEFVRKRYLR